MVWIAAQHVPADVLADYLCGLSIEGLSQRELHQHLAQCTECREEVDAVLGAGAPTHRGTASDPPTTLREPAHQVWKPLALAASLVAMLAAPGWLLQSRPSSRETLEEMTVFRTPLAGLPVAELLPEDVRRGDPESETTTVDRGAGAFLVLIAALEHPDPNDRWRARLRDASGREVFTTPPAAADATGALTVLVPTSLLRLGSAELVVYGLREPSPEAHYRFVVFDSTTSQPEVTKEAQ
jgi:hypothetical protein